MKIFTLDASVIIKWIFPESVQEEHVPQALTILEAIKNDLVRVIQPPHWLAEVAAVIVRLSPGIVKKSMELLHAMEFSIANSSEIYHTACQLSHGYKHHLFDTLYHAVALHNRKAYLITADEKYYRKSSKEGGIIRLADYSLFS